MEMKIKLEMVIANGKQCKLLCKILCKIVTFGKHENEKRKHMCHLALKHEQ